MPATPQKNNQAVRRLTCPHCKTRFRTTSIKKLYCTPQCQREATKKKRRVSRVDRAVNAAFFYHLAYECERAGTLQILAFHTVESLVQLYEIYKLRLKANRYGATKDYAISHIHPVQGESAIGLFHPANLVVVPTKLNRDHGTQHHGHGLSINRSALVSKHSVEKGTPRKQTVQRIIAFLGADVVAEVVKVAKIQPTQRHKVLSWLHDHLDPTMPEQRAHLDNLDDMTTIALTALKASVQGEESNGFTIKTRTYTPLEVLLLGLAQQTAYRPELSAVHDAIYAAIGPFLSANFGSDWTKDFSLVDVVESLSRRPSLRAILAAPELLQALFDVLHGKEVSDIRPMLDSFTQRCKERQGLSQSITYKAQQPLLLGTLSFLANAREFADELDAVEGAYVQDVIPVLPRAIAMQPGNTLAYEHDPLPWG